ncbi:lysophosphatidic acid phosphatase type 6-like, partial [Saccoglossus kowalevskii]|uniref:Lysophosphatidic acid phosphatase type 6-like n=1 Tax=Saccoglossus kowalevskii TaxID=10224 RepID=A0ABM0MXS5_SACKO
MVRLTADINKFLSFTLSSRKFKQVWDKETLFSGGEGLLAHYVVKGLDGGAMPESRLDAVYREVLFKGGTFAGQLTTKGKQQMHALGGVYKKYYIDTLQFLDPKFTPEHIYIRSTNVNRTIESAACVLAGMFGNHIKKKDPVSILVASSTDEILYPNAYFCNRFAAINKNLWNDNDTMPGMRHSRRQLQDMLGIPQNERLDIVKLRDVLACQK